MRIKPFNCILTDGYRHHIPVDCIHLCHNQDNKFLDKNNTLGRRLRTDDYMVAGI